VCTVLLRLEPGARCPILLGAVRDEFVERAWDPPARHWPAAWSHLLGGRDQVAGGTWLAVDPHAPAVAALLNAGRRDDDGEGPRPTRGTLALRILAAEGLPADLARYDRFHLLRATLDLTELWSWDGDSLHHQVLPPGDHIIVNAGLDTHTDPLVPHFEPLLATTPTDPAAWTHLLAGDGLAPDDDRALLVRREVEGRRYGSTSASLVALSPTEVRYEFTATPAEPSWYPVEIDRPPAGARAL
jgi:uncharacterized protein with NRDE domain